MTQPTLESLHDERVPLVEVFKPEDWMTPKEVADVFGVKPRTVHRWFETNPNFGNIRAFKTPGGHKRFYRPDIMNAVEIYENIKQVSE